MNSQEQEHAPSLELPQAPAPERVSAPAPERGQVAVTSEAQAAATLEQAGGQSAVPQVPPPMVPAQTSSQPQADPVLQSAVGGAAYPQIADDNDLIEKEWVLKAKEIVAQTAHDPHLQNEAISRFKADYLKKRYNKDIKLSEDE